MKLVVFACCCLMYVGACAEQTEAEQRRAITLFDFKESLINGTPVGATVDNPAGFAPSTFLKQQGDKYAVVPQAAFAEGKPAAFVTTEIWVDRSEIWVQPGYVMVTEWSEASPFSKVLRDPAGQRAATIFDVGQDSAFYSPFWQFRYAVVSPSTPVDKYRTSLDVFNDDLTVHDGNFVLCSLAPDDVVVPDPLQHPLMGVTVRGFSVSAVKAWVNGQAVSYLAQGGGNFRVGPRLVVQETPMFRFVKRGGDGQNHPVLAPMVVGFTPLLSGQPNTTVPSSAYTRLYLATLPATAAAFDQGERPNATAALLAMGVLPSAYQGRIALNGLPAASTMGAASCFDAATFPASCTWLDSQQKIETQLGPANLRRTSITWTSPTVILSEQAPKAMP